MNFFLNGNFKIEESWNKKPSVKHSSSKEKDNKSFVSAGKNIVSDSIPDALDDQVAKHILREFQAEIPPPPSIKSQKKISRKDCNAMPPKPFKGQSSNSENELITSMASRLKTLQMTCKNLKEEVKQKNGIIEKLKAQGNFVKGFRQDASKAFEKIENLQLENKGLKQKVEEMENYLKKYGLKWVGSKIQGKLQQQKIKQAIKKGNYQYRLPSQIDINTIIRRVQQLNSGLQSQGRATQIYSENGVHKFKKAEPLPMGFFSNGIAIKGFKFFSYQQKQSLQILGDIIDGYFPYVLKAKYPHGVFLNVVPKLSQKYDNTTEGQSIQSLQSIKKDDFKPPSKEQFLMKMPKNIVKNGKIISIRDEIEKRLNGVDQKLIKEETNQDQNQFYQKIDGANVFKTEAQSQLQKQNITEDDICCLKIRDDKGQVFILQLYKHASVKDIYKWMRKVTQVNFKLMSNFPFRAYEESQEENLEELGFFPNAMLHIQLK